MYCTLSPHKTTIQSSFYAEKSILAITVDLARSHTRLIAIVTIQVQVALFNNKQDYKMRDFFKSKKFRYYLQFQLPQDFTPEH